MKGFFEWIAGRRGETGERASLDEMENCLYCGVDLTSAEIFQRYRICPQCGFHYLLPAYERIELLADSGSFIEINRSLASLDPISFSGGGSYKKRVLDAQKRTGLSEAVVTRRLPDRGHPYCHGGIGLRLSGWRDGLCCWGKGNPCL